MNHPVKKGVPIRVIVGEPPKPLLSGAAGIKVNETASGLFFLEFLGASFTAKIIILSLDGLMDRLVFGKERFTVRVLDHLLGGGNAFVLGRRKQNSNQNNEQGDDNPDYRESCHKPIVKLSPFKFNGKRSSANAPFPRKIE